MSSRQHDQWEVGALTITRAIGYIVGLPSFILGTATFMLGFALSNGGILNVACLLYGLSALGMGWRLAAGRYRPSGLAVALKILLGVCAAAFGVYWALRGVLLMLGAPA